MRTTAFLLALVLSVPAGLCQAPVPGALPPEVVVARVVDGDTIVVEDAAGKRRSVRLVGVDTPETVHPRKPVEPYGPEASDFAKKSLTGKRVRLVPDSRAGDADRYGRTLAYVFVGDECFNETLIRGGYGRAYVKYPFEPATRTRFLIVEDAAREARRGLWSLEAGNGKEGID